MRAFDYIIVGAGSAGCVVASRLTEDPEVSVLLLEAGGGDRHPLLRMPIVWPLAAIKPSFNWGYSSEPEPHLNGRRIPLPRGKMLGGSSGINAVGYRRGHRLDYDGWRDRGLPGWGYADVLPYFKRSERSWRGEGPYHGADGPMSIVPGDAPQLLWEPLRQAVRAAGYPDTADIHGDVTEGLACNELTIDRFGRRQSTARSFLKPAMRRSNLTVVKRAFATRVMVADRRASGVEYEVGGRVVQAAANREVILCGGAYNSPQLLMLSGIGPADQLSALDIPVTVDLPGVGRNLMEHPLVPVIMEAAQPITLLRHLRLDRAAWWTLRWLVGAGGLYATAGLTGALFLRSHPELKQPDLQLICSSIHRDARPWLPGRIGAQKHIFQCAISLLHPESSGSVTLRSADPHDKVRIRLNLFAEPADIDTAIRGIRRARELYAQPPMRGLIRKEMIPGAAAQTDADLAAHVWRSAATTQHAAGTCRMGTDGLAVVDAELKVHGIDGLRVVDASVMPTMPGGNINAPVIMIAEKASDMIRRRRLPAADI